jgi:hypothetical protein
VTRSRAFWLWYAAVLTPLVVGIESARAWQPPPPEEPPLEAAILAMPPKPDAGVDEARDGTGQDYSWDRCDTLPGDFRDTCFAALARQLAERDPDGALSACAEVNAGEQRDECVADVAEGHALVDLPRSHAICADIKSLKWRSQCVFGIAMAYAQVDPELAMATCEQTGMWRPFCRHDVNGERAVTDPEGAIATCEALPSARRDTCWHGLGKYIARVDVHRALTACERAPLHNDNRGQCIHGVGWAAAESRGSEALPICEVLGPMRDSCVMGVAYQAKRYNPEEATRLCELTHDAGEREHCLEFVQRRPARSPTPLP